MTKDELKELIAALQAQLKRLERRPWKPKDGDDVYLLYTNGSISQWSYNSKSAYHAAALSRGMIFPTREEAELYDRKRIAVTAIKDYVAENMPFTPDWNDGEQKKWFPYYEHFHEQWCATPVNTTQFNFLLPYVGSIDDGERLLRDCKEHLDVLLEEL